MPRISATELGEGGHNICAFLDMLASPGVEGTSNRGDDGYNVIVGGQLFSGYQLHPNRSIWLPRYRIYSTAAGRYQFLNKIWLSLQRMLKLPDFSPKSQDLGAIELIRENGALDLVREGRVRAAITRCNKTWASLPGAGYGQREAKMSALLDIYRAAGGTLVED